MLKDFPRAESEFQQAVDLFPLENSEKGDWLAHLGEAVYKNGRKDVGEKIVLEGVQQIQAYKDGEDPFKINVWISGAYMRLAKILINDQNIERAKIYLAKAEEIILKDPRLVIRKQQLEILKKSIDS